MSTEIVWFRHDLRLADNPLLDFPTPPEQLICVYVLDTRWLWPALPGLAARRIGPARLQFLWQSLIELRGELLKRGSDLLVRIDPPSATVARPGRPADLAVLGELNGLAWRAVLGDDRADHGNVLQERR